MRIWRILHFIHRHILYSDRILRTKPENISYTELGGVKPNPRSGLVYEGIDICRREGIDFILAVGGGSVIDSSKAIAAGTIYDGMI